MSAKSLVLSAKRVKCRQNRAFCLQNCCERLGKSPCLYFRLVSLGLLIKNADKTLYFVDKTAIIEIRLPQSH